MQKERRDFVGRRIKRERRQAGFRSQRAFADALGIHETSVARAETGDERVGDAVFTAIETRLNWPADSIARYLETGDEALLAPATVPGPEPDRPLTKLESLTYLIYLELRVQRIKHEEAHRIAVEIGRLLGQDEAALTAAIERESHPAM